MAIQAQLLPLNEVLYWPSMKVLAMTQPNAAVLSKATLLRGMIVSTGRRCCPTRSNVFSQTDRRGGGSFQATLREHPTASVAASQRNPHRVMS
jgi:hypothetical protein